MDVWERCTIQRYSPASRFESCLVRMQSDVKTSPGWSVLVRRVLGVANVECVIKSMAAECETNTLLASEK